VIAWDAVPKGHRSREYVYVSNGVRCTCQCRWTSTLARTMADACSLWVVHIRSLVRGTRP